MKRSSRAFMSERNLEFFLIFLLILAVNLYQTSL
jgi:hypothetical protein